MKARIPMNSKAKKIMNQEIRNQILRIDEKNATLCDSNTLLALSQMAGWGKKRLRKFWDVYIKLEHELAEYYAVDHFDSKSGQIELNFYAMDELKRIGVDVEYWRQMGDKWTPENDACWQAHK